MGALLFFVFVGLVTVTAVKVTLPFVMVNSEMVTALLSFI
jgi:hypothetical protein